MDQDITFDSVFQELKNLLQPYREQLSLQADTPGYYSLETVSPSFRGRPLFFGSVQIKKNYVSFYLMPVYVFPDLLTDLPAGLLKRMQGKSCFNFRRLDEIPLADLQDIIRLGYERYRQEGLL